MTTIETELPKKSAESTFTSLDARVVTLEGSSKHETEMTLLRENIAQLTNEGKQVTKIR